MSITDLIGRFKLPEIQKYSLGFALLIMGWLVGFFVNSSKERDIQQSEAFKSAIAYYRSRDIEREKYCDSISYYWQSRYFKEVETNSKYFRQLDSANRAALQRPAERILKTVQ